METSSSSCCNMICTLQLDLATFLDKRHEILGDYWSDLGEGVCRLPFQYVGGLYRVHITLERSFGAIDT